MSTPPVVTLDEDELRRSLARLLRLATSRERRRSTATVHPTEVAHAAADETLLFTLVQLMLAHEHAVLGEGRTGPSAPDSALVDEIATLLIGGAPATQVALVLAREGRSPTDAQLDALDDALSPGAIASVGGPQEAARRVVALFTPTRNVAASTDVGDEHVRAFVTDLLGAV